VNWHGRWEYRSTRSYAWKAKYGGLEVDEAQELLSLRDENARLKKLVADLSLDKEMLKALIAKNSYSSRA